MRSLAVALALTLLAGCLPDRKSPEVLGDSLSGSDSVQTTDTATDVPPAASCGNAKVDPGEGCDPGPGGNVCSECVACQPRRALNVSSDKALALTAGVQKFVPPEKGDLVLSGWVQMRKVPQTSGSQAVMVVFGTGTTTGPVGGTLNVDYFYGFGLSRPGAGSTATHPACSVAASTKVVGGKEQPVVTAVALWPDPLPPDSWHHVTCFLKGRTKLGIIVDGKKAVVTDVSNADKLKLAGQAQFVFGAVPQSKDKAAVGVFDGLLDEVRVSSSAEDQEISKVPWRWADGMPSTLALYHLDLAADARQAADSGPNPVPAQQTSYSGSTAVAQQEVLPTSPEACFGYQPAQAECKDAKNAPWCGK